MSAAGQAEGSVGRAAASWGPLAVSDPQGRSHLPLAAHVSFTALTGHGDLFLGWPHPPCPAGTHPPWLASIPKQVHCLSVSGAIFTGFVDKGAKGRDRKSRIVVFSGIQSQPQGT